MILRRAWRPPYKKLTPLTHCGKQDDKFQGVNMKGHPWIAILRLHCPVKLLSSSFSVCHLINFLWNELVVFCFEQARRFFPRGTAFTTAAILDNLAAIRAISALNDWLHYTQKSRASFAFLIFSPLFTIQYMHKIRKKSRAMPCVQLLKVLCRLSICPQSGNFLPSF